jgi:hypothetical protein
LSSNTPASRRGSLETALPARTLQAFLPGEGMGGAGSLVKFSGNCLIAVIGTLGEALAGREGQHQSAPVSRGADVVAVRRESSPKDSIP